MVFVSCGFGWFAPVTHLVKYAQDQGISWDTITGQMSCDSVRQMLVEELVGVAPPPDFEIPRN